MSDKPANPGYGEGVQNAVRMLMEGMRIPDVVIVELSSETVSVATDED